jgi:outer membrane immunogenic protein
MRSKFAIFLTVALGLVAAQAASAADMPVKAPIYKAPVVAPWSWTGFYIGANAGYSWGRSNTTETITNAAGAALVTNSGTFNMNGAIGGGQIGYNWQSNNWVFGLEADIQFSGQKGSGDFVCPACNPGPFGAAFLPQIISGTLDQKLKWFGTLRPRAGVLVTPDTLAYVTGGLAYGGIDSNLALSTPNPAVSNAFSSSTTKAGWTVGLGVESRLSGNWTAKLEYLYMDLGTVSNSYATTIPAVGGGFASVNYSSRITDNILRVGLNYAFH